MSLTERQRVALVARLERAILWHQATTSQRDTVRSIAIALVRELATSGANDRAVRRGLEVVTQRLDETA